MRNRIVWHFGHGLHCTKRLSGRYETISWWTKGDDYTWNLDPIRVRSKYPNKRYFKGPKAGELSGNPKGKNPSDVWAFPNVKNNHPEKTIHPCQFPVELAERLVLSMTDAEDAVLDPYMGVGSSVLAALMHDRAALWVRHRAGICEHRPHAGSPVARRHLAHAPYGEAHLRSEPPQWRALMRIRARYSHLNGEEYLLVHRRALWREVRKVIAAVDAQACRTKVSEERGRVGKRLYSPVAMNRAFKAGFRARGWREPGLARTPERVLGNGRRQNHALHLRAPGE